MSTRDPVPPVVCTLSTGARTAQELEWSDLAALALTSERVDGGIASTYPLDLAGDIEQLAERERDCCGTWLDVSTTRVDDGIRVVLTTTNPEGLELILSFAGSPSS